MADTETFAIGDVVYDCEDDDPNVAIVVNTPSQPAQEWHAHGGHSVAEDNPEYPADASVIVVAFADALQAAFPDWEGSGPLPLTAINESNASHYSFPAPRLTAADTAFSELSNDDDFTSDSDGTTPSREDADPSTDVPSDRASEEDDSLTADDATATEPELSASMCALKERLEEGGMSVEVEPDGQALAATKLGDTYRVRPGEIIKGDGALRSKLASIVDKYE